MHRHRFLLLLAVLVLASGHSKAEQTKVFQKEHASVGLFPEDHPPLYWHNGQQGIVQQLLSAIEKHSRFTFEVKLYPFNRLIQHIADGTVDIEPWTSPAWRQPIKSEVYFTEPFTQHCETMVFKKNQSFSIRSPSQLIGKKIGTIQDFIFPSYAGLFKRKLIRRISGTDERSVMNMLTLGRSDIAFMDKTAADFLIKKSYSSILETKNTFDCVPITFMFNKKKSDIGREINRILQELKAKKEIEKIRHAFQ